MRVLVAVFVVALAGLLAGPWNEEKCDDFCSGVVAEMWGTP